MTTTIVLLLTALAAGIALGVWVTIGVAQLTVTPPP